MEKRTRSSPSLSNFHTALYEMCSSQQISVFEWGGIQSTMTSPPIPHSSAHTCTILSPPKRPRHHSTQKFHRPLFTTALLIPDPQGFSPAWTTIFLQIPTNQFPKASQADSEDLMMAGDPDVATFSALFFVPRTFTYLFWSVTSSYAICT